MLVSFSGPYIIIYYIFTISNIHNYISADYLVYVFAYYHLLPFRVHISILQFFTLHSGLYGLSVTIFIQISNTTLFTQSSWGVFYFPFQLTKFQIQIYPIYFLISMRFFILLLNSCWNSIICLRFTLLLCSFVLIFKFAFSFYVFFVFNKGLSSGIPNQLILSLFLKAYQLPNPLFLFV